MARIMGGIMHRLGVRKADKEYEGGTEQERRAQFGAGMGDSRSGNSLADNGLIIHRSVSFTAPPAVLRGLVSRRPVSWLAGRC